MGQLIQLFPKKSLDSDSPNLDRNQRIRLNFIETSIKSLHLEELALEQSIQRKCPQEISRLKSLDLKISQLEGEAARILSRQPSSSAS
ncbi:hypothetical protein HYY75_10315 [bacterium]|nr:hypothetical protein [bacterium]